MLHPRRVVRIATALVAGNAPAGLLWAGSVTPGALWGLAFGRCWTALPGSLHRERRSCFSSFLRRRRLGRQDKLSRINVSRFDLSEN
jgi:hypothetical protein